MDFFKLVADVGFPIASAIAAGYFVFLTLKFIFAEVRLDLFEGVSPLAVIVAE